jgi:thiosulfate/3-mercaptopyruvate sulfurtransferase
MCSTPSKYLIAPTPDYLGTAKLLQESARSPTFPWLLERSRDMSCSLLCSLLLFVPAQGDAKSYPRAELLIEANELAKPDVAKKFRILDTRPVKEFVAKRLPYSSWVDVAGWNKKFTAGPDVQFFTAELGLLGIDVDVPVVVVGDDLRETARVWWILRYWGVKDVRLLNGGWEAWLAGKHPTWGPNDGKEPFYKPSAPKLMPAEKRLATKEQVKDSLKDKALQIIDSRSEGEFCGEIKLAKKGGAIPGAINLEWKVLVDNKTQKFKSAADLEQIFKKAGIDLAKPSVAHCQSGGRSSVMVFAMELMGANDARNYYRSWAEWGNANDTPIEMPKKKGP